MQDEIKDFFKNVVENNEWGGEESLSGPGSDFTQTTIIRDAIPALLKRHNIHTMLDAPCGDFFWMKEIKPLLFQTLHKYVGADIVSSIIARNQEHYGDEKFSFITFDITKDSIPKVDLIFTRDCFLHLSYGNIYKALLNYKKSGARYLLVSTYTKPRPNINVDGFSINGRAINLQLYPFFLSEPIELINEGCTEGNNEYNDKSLGLWNLNDIRLTKLRIYLFLKCSRDFIKSKLGKR